MNDAIINKLFDINTPIAFLEMHNDTRVNNRLISKKACMLINFPLDDVNFALFITDGADIGFIGDKILLFIVNNRHNHTGLSYLYDKLLLSGYNIMINNIRYDPMKYNSYLVHDGEVTEPDEVLSDTIS